MGSDAVHIASAGNAGKGEGTCFRSLRLSLQTFLSTVLTTGLRQSWAFLSFWIRFFPQALWF